LGAKIVEFTYVQLVYVYETTLYSVFVLNINFVNLFETSTLRRMSETKLLICYKTSA